MYSTFYHIDVHLSDCHSRRLLTLLTFLALSIDFAPMFSLWLVCNTETLPNRSSNTIRWSPRGRHAVLATVGSSSKSELEFWDLDFNLEDMGGRKDVNQMASKDEWGSGIQLLGSADHYGVTDVEWDPSGRHLATSASAWRHTVCGFRFTTSRFPSFHANSRSGIFFPGPTTPLTNLRQSNYASWRTDTRYGTSKARN